MLSEEEELSGVPVIVMVLKAVMKYFATMQNICNRECPISCNDFRHMVVLQNCVGFVKDEPDSFSETCFTSSDDGIDEVDIIFEEAIDVKEEAVEFPFLKAEHEVSIGVGVCMLAYV